MKYYWVENKNKQMHEYIPNDRNTKAGGAIIMNPEGDYRATAYNDFNLASYKYDVKQHSSTVEEAKSWVEKKLSEFNTKILIELQQQINDFEKRYCIE